MERLTREMTFEEEYSFLQKEAKELFDKEDRESEPPESHSVVCRALRCIKKLVAEVEPYKAYKDLEEQGLLLRLPCKVGDTVYKLWYKPCHNGETYPDSYDCCGCEDECDIKRDVFAFVVPDLNWILSNYRYLTSKNDNMFLTEEEAKARLKELEGSEDK